MKAETLWRCSMACWVLCIVLGLLATWLPLFWKIAEDLDRQRTPRKEVPPTTIYVPFAP